MNSEQDRITAAVSGALIVAAGVGLVLALLGGCAGDSGESSGPCDWFALAAAPAGTLKPAPAAPRSAGDRLRKDSAPSRPASPGRLQKGRATPAVTASSHRHPARHHGDGFDLCD